MFPAVENKSFKEDFIHILSFLSHKSIREGDGTAKLISYVTGSRILDTYFI